MNASWQGHHDARGDAEFDVSHEIPRRPRPRFFPSILSKQYRVAYMSAYRRAYESALRRFEQEIASELAARSKLISGDQVPRDRVFERGWRDGFDNRDTLPDGYEHTEVAAYERGHRIGKQHREAELAHQLQNRNRHQNLR